MIYRYVIKVRPRLNSSGELVNTNTTEYVNGVTLGGLWTNSNTYPTSSNPNNYPQPVDKTVETSITEFDQNVFNKTLTIPISLDLKPIDNSDLIDGWVFKEEQKSINKIIDSEKIKYKPYNVTDGYYLRFRFMNDNKTYNNDYDYVGFTSEDTKKNVFKKSYFRLYFYNELESDDLIFTEDIDVEGTTSCEFKMKDLYWDMSDYIFNDNSSQESDVYMEAKFFNAKTGKVQSFYNLPTTENSPINILKYGDVENRGWRRSKIVFNKPTSQSTLGDRRFKLSVGGGTSDDGIILSEFILD